jgi:hypothetical protein
VRLPFIDQSILSGHEAVINANERQAVDARGVPSRSVTDSRKSNATSWSLSAAGGIVLLGEPLTPRFLIASAATLTWASAGARGPGPNRTDFAKILIAVEGR